MYKLFLLHKASRTIKYSSLTRYFSYLILIAYFSLNLHSLKTKNIWNISHKDMNYLFHLLQLTWNPYTAMSFITSGRQVSHVFLIHSKSNTFSFQVWWISWFLLQVNCLLLFGFNNKLSIAVELFQTDFLTDRQFLRTGPYKHFERESLWIPLRISPRIR